MIALTSLVVFAGIFASWEVEFLTKEFFVSLILLATGVFGFFISIDLFTMFLFYELAVIPMYLLDWNLGYRSERIFCHEAYPDADGWISSSSGWSAWNLF